MKHKIIVIAFMKYAITGIPNIQFDNYWSARQYLSRL